MFKNSSESEALSGSSLVLSFGEPGADDVSLVGGKFASLDRLSRIEGVNVPEAKAITSNSFDLFVAENPQIQELAQSLDKASTEWIRLQLTAESIQEDLSDEIRAVENHMRAFGKNLRGAVGETEIPDQLKGVIVTKYKQMCDEAGTPNLEVALRSSAPIEDSAVYSFAGQYDTLFNNRGEEQVLLATRACFESQFTDRVISYRNNGRLKEVKEIEKLDGFEVALKQQSIYSHQESKLAVAMQRMVESKAAGTTFSVDPITGASLFYIEAVNGLGESAVDGNNIPDGIYIDPTTRAIVGKSRGAKRIKAVYSVGGGTEIVDTSEEERTTFAITDYQVDQLSQLAELVTDEYDNDAMDLEWGFDEDGKLWALQARPDTVASKIKPGIIDMRRNVVKAEALKDVEAVIEAGQEGSPGVAVGVVRYCETIEEAWEKLEPGDILVTRETTPEWEELMDKASAIVTEVGGVLSHAAIVSREAGIPCLVGIRDAFVGIRALDGQEITVDATETKIYQGLLPLEMVGELIDVNEIKNNPSPIPVGLILANPRTARKMHALRELGSDFLVGLLRVEFLLNNIGVHVRALIDYDEGKLDNERDTELISIIENKIGGYDSGQEYFVEKLAQGIAAIAAIFPDSEMTIRTTDFKTNEYEGLPGGYLYEGEEANPMMGDRGTIRYMEPEYRQAILLEFAAINRVMEMGYENIKVMLPMVRDPIELSGIPVPLEQAKEWLLERDYSPSVIPEIVDYFTPVSEGGKGYLGVYQLMQLAGLQRGEKGIPIGMMVENPINAISIHRYENPDFFSFGTNDLTQFIEAADRDNPKLQQIPWLTAENPAVVDTVREVISYARENGIRTGICGNAASLYPGFAKMLYEAGIDDISVFPDRYLATVDLLRQTVNE